jgi:hypothetical protein
MVWTVGTSGICASGGERTITNALSGADLHRVVGTRSGKLTENGQPRRYSLVTAEKRTIGTKHTIVELGVPRFAVKAILTLPRGIFGGIYNSFAC